MMMKMKTLPPIYMHKIIILSLLLSSLLPPPPSEPASLFATIGIYYSLYRYFSAHLVRITFLRGSAKLCANLRLSTGGDADEAAEATQAAHLTRMWFAHLVLNDPHYGGPGNLTTLEHGRWHHLLLKKTGCHLEPALVRRLPAEADPSVMFYYNQIGDIQQQQQPARPRQPLQRWFSWPVEMLQQHRMAACSEMKEYVKDQGLSYTQLRYLFLSIYFDHTSFLGVAFSGLQQEWWYDWRAARRRLANHVWNRHAGIFASGADGDGGWRRRRRRRKRMPEMVQKFKSDEQQQQDEPEQESSSNSSSVNNASQAQLPQTQDRNIDRYLTHLAGNILAGVAPFGQEYLEPYLTEDQQGEILLMQALLCPMKQDYTRSAYYVRSQIGVWSNWTRNPILKTNQGTMVRLRDETTRLNLWAILSLSSLFNARMTPLEREALYQHVLMHVFGYTEEMLSRLETPLGSSGLLTTKAGKLPAMVDLRREFLFFATFPLTGEQGRGFERADFFVVLDNFIQQELKFLRSKCGLNPKDDPEVTTSVRPVCNQSSFSLSHVSKGEWTGDRWLGDQTVRYLNRWTELLLTVCPTMLAIVRNVRMNETLAHFFPRPGGNGTIGKPGPSRSQLVLKPRQPPKWRNPSNHSSMSKATITATMHYNQAAPFDPDNHSDNQVQVQKNSTQQLERWLRQARQWSAQFVGLCKRNPKTTAGCGIPGTLGLIWLVSSSLGGGNTTVVATTANNNNSSNATNNATKAPGSEDYSLPFDWLGTDPTTRLLFVISGLVLALGILVLLVGLLWFRFCGCSYSGGGGDGKPKSAVKEKDNKKDKKAKDKTKVIKHKGKDKDKDKGESSFNSSSSSNSTTKKNGRSYRKKRKNGKKEKHSDKRIKKNRKGKKKHHNVTSRSMARSMSRDHHR